jgi:hypothetical protein
MWEGERAERRMKAECRRKMEGQKAEERKEGRGDGSIAQSRVQRVQEGDKAGQMADGRKHGETADVSIGKRADSSGGVP